LYTDASGSMFSPASDIISVRYTIDSLAKTAICMSASAC